MHVTPLTSASNVCNAWPYLMLVMLMLNQAAAPARVSLLTTIQSTARRKCTKRTQQCQNKTKPMASVNSVHLVHFAQRARSRSPRLLFALVSLLSFTPRPSRPPPPVAPKHSSLCPLALALFRRPALPPSRLPTRPQEDATDEAMAKVEAE